MGREWLEREGDVVAFDCAFFGGESEGDGCMGLRSWMVRKGANVDGRWWRMGSPSRERGRCGWVVLSSRRSVGLWVQLWGVESMGLGFEGAKA